MTFWDDNATPEGVFNVGDMYDEYTARQADFIVEQLGAETGLLLDVGCGIGRVSAAVLDRLPDMQVVGSDPSWPMLEKAMQRKATERFRPWHTDALSSFSGPFRVDGAWCVLTFQHLPDHTVKRHLADLFSILKPGARLVTQWVEGSTHGEEGPMSYPRYWLDIYDLHRDAGFDVHPEVLTDDFVTKYADNWLWVVAEKPA